MARATQLLAFALIALGVLPAVFAIALVVWQAAMWLQTGTWIALPSRLLVDPSLLQSPKLASLAPFVPSLDWAWANHPHSLQLLNKLLAVLLDRVHLGILAVAVGYAIGRSGALLAARQAEILEWQEQQRADRRRRIAQYAGS